MPIRTHEIEHDGLLSAPRIREDHIHIVQGNSELQVSGRSAAYGTEPIVARSVPPTISHRKKATGGEACPGAFGASELTGLLDQMLIQLDAERLEP